MIFFTSDTHFGHDRGFIYEPRGFKSIEEHDEAIIERWNSVVGHDDTVYHLGDAMLGADHEYGINCLRRLNGQIFMIRGNHDTTRRWEEYQDEWPHLVTLGWAHILKTQGYRFYLCHYPTIVSQPEDSKSLRKGLINLCGHYHTKDRWIDWDKGKIYHVELDCQNNSPVSLEQVILDLESHKNLPIKNVFLTSK